MQEFFFLHFTLSHFSVYLVVYDGKFCRNDARQGEGARMDDSMGMTLVDYRLRKLRKRQSAIAIRAGCPQGQIIKIERYGHMPRPWDLERYAEAYECSVPRLQRMIQASRAARSSASSSATGRVSRPSDSRSRMWSPAR